MRKGGQVQLIIGPMFSGKSTELVRRMRRFQHARLNCLVVKSKLDIRYSNDSLSTHDQMIFDAMPVKTLVEVQKIAQDYDVIGIDEGQFFPDLVSFCEAVANTGKVVIVAALDGTFEKQPFGDVCKLVPMAESVVKLSAVCNSCGQDAAFTKRLVPDKNVTLIGGSEAYEPRCRECFNAP